MAERVFEKLFARVSALQMVEESSAPTEDGGVTCAVDFRVIDRGAWEQILLGWLALLHEHSDGVRGEVRKTYTPDRNGVPTFSWTLLVYEVIPGEMEEFLRAMTAATVAVRPTAASAAPSRKPADYLSPPPAVPPMVDAPAGRRGRMTKVVERSIDDRGRETVRWVVLLPFVKGGANRNAPPANLVQHAHIGGAPKGTRRGAYAVRSGSAEDPAMDGDR